MIWKKKIKFGFVVYSSELGDEIVIMVKINKIFDSNILCKPIKSVRRKGINHHDLFRSISFKEQLFKKSSVFDIHEEELNWFERLFI